MDYKYLISAFKKRVREDEPLRFFYRLIRFFLLRVILFKNSLFRKVVRAKIRRLEGKYVIENVLGSKMYLDLSRDAGVSWELYKVGIREPFITSFLQKEIKEGDVIVDIGANIGYYALLESKLVGEKGKVYAIEPVPESVNLLKKNISLNRRSNIEVFQLAIGGRITTDYIYISPALNVSSLIKPKANRFIKKIKIKVTTLDEFLKDKPFPTLIRMDVEGYEIEIIKGMRNILESNKPLKILIEIHPHIIKEKILELLHILKANHFEVKIATKEPWPCVLREPKFIQKILDFLGERTDFKPGYLNLKINDMLKDKFLIEGRRACWEIFFERK